MLCRRMKLVTSSPPYAYSVTLALSNACAAFASHTIRLHIFDYLRSCCSVEGMRDLDRPYVAEVRLRPLRGDPSRPPFPCRPSPTSCS